jgi:septal ring factor EnvC (AmiA/AmiB activator)
MNLEPTSQENEKEEAKGSAPQVTQPPARKRYNFSLAVIGILLVILLGVGFWAIRLNFTVGSTQEQLAALQSDHTKLESENKQLVEDLKIANASLEQKTKELATAKADLKIAKDQNKTLRDKMDLASETAEILDAFFNVDKAIDFFALSTMVQATRDRELIKQWDAYRSSSSSESTFNLLHYMVGSIRDELE